MHWVSARFYKMDDTKGKSVQLFCISVRNWDTGFYKYKFRTVRPNSTPLPNPRGLGDFGELELLRNIIMMDNLNFLYK